jgi:hypothetical protein
LHHGFQRADDIGPGRPGRRDEQATPGRHDRGALQPAPDQFVSPSVVHAPPSLRKCMDHEKTPSVFVRVIGRGRRRPAGFPVAHPTNTVSSSNRVTTTLMNGTGLPGSTGAALAFATSSDATNTTSSAESSHRSKHCATNARATEQADGSAANLMRRVSPAAIRQGRLPLIVARVQFPGSPGHLPQETPDAPNPSRRGPVVARAKRNPAPAHTGQRAVHHIDFSHRFRSPSSRFSKRRLERPPLLS